MDVRSSAWQLKAQGGDAIPMRSDNGIGEVIFCAICIYCSREESEGLHVSIKSSLEVSMALLNRNIGRALPYLLEGETQYPSSGSFRPRTFTWCGNSSRQPGYYTCKHAGPQSPVQASDQHGIRVAKKCNSTRKAHPSHKALSVKRLSHRFPPHSGGLDVSERRAARKSIFALFP